MAATTIDRTSKVTLGILITLLGTFVGGAVYATNLKNSVDTMVEGMSELKAEFKEARIALERNTTQIAIGEATLGMLQVQMESLSSRVTALEKQ